MTGLRDRLQRLARVRRDAGRSAPKNAGRVAVNADRLVDVVELVSWVYAEQRAHIVDGRGIGLHEGEMIAEGVLDARRAGGGSGYGRFHEIQLLGCKIDRVGYDMGDLHPVAEAVNAMIGKIGGGGLIVRFAAKRDIPPGASFDIRLAPRWKSEPRWQLGPCAGCGQQHQLPMQGTFVVWTRNKRPVYCPLDFDYEPEYLAQLRQEYIAWHDALSELVVRCCYNREKIGGLVVTGPKLLREPWRQGRTYKGVKGSI